MLANEKNPEFQSPREWASGRRAHPSPRVDEPEVIASSVYANGRRVTDIAIDEAGGWSRRPGHVVWIGLLEPAAELLQRIQLQFDLHSLAIEDASKAHQQPKVEQYGGALFVVARTAQLIDGHIVFGETHIFVGKGYVVSVRHGASTSYAAVRERCETCITSLAQGEDYILYAILDFIVDNYSPVIEALQAEVEALEEAVLRRSRVKFEFDRLYKLRRDLLQLRRAVGPVVDVCRRLEHMDVIALDDAMKPLFRDVLDHAKRAQEDIDSLREILAFAFEASMMAGQSQQTEITRRLAAWAAILAVPTAVAGIYGMNFENMPELKWAYGYYVVLAGIFGACALLYARFRQSGWL
ncbi:magnesium and cobalt transport protein CorA [Bradyrhizobium cenepequi]|uniref:magnesium and cobalt transport protein CorA n=1 Tax=Bradyrhizobium cenepequi TaxID=2821403 RepID=UPI001CE33050|nr:magnesium and cobalt transport protein CorA [Bradyrhizobium cenepequi]MCA6108387.1 magnesium and cobalt transport protein CorA [Bradyrhizobium cenepequi]